MSESSLVVRSQVASATNYSDYREFVRADFWFSCAYCTSAESECRGIRFEIDHYVPVSADTSLATTFENLLWACEHCNQFKKDLVPPARADQDGWIFFRPDRHEFHEHFALNDLLLTSKSATGRFTTIVLNLNRQTLRRIRQIRRDWYAVEQQTAIGLRGLVSLPLDRLHSIEAKAYVASKVALLTTEAQGVTNAITEAIAKSLAQSELVDSDPNREEQSKTRRGFLKELKAIYPERWYGRAKKTK